VAGCDLDGLPSRLNPRRGRPESRGLLPGIAAVLSLAILLITVSGWGITSYYNGRIHRTGIGAAGDANRPPPGATGTSNWLLVGSDVRTGSDAAKVQGARSDTMMIAHMAADGATTAVSIPRDLRVQIPAWIDPDGHTHPAHRDKVNAAFNAGGPALLVTTLEDLSGLRIDHFAEIDFGGFTAMSAAIGGVDVCIAHSSYVETFRLDNGRPARATNVSDPNSGFSGHGGINHLVGPQALAFVRQRHGFVDGDLARIRRQQAFMGAVFRAVVGGGTLLSPTRLTAFLRAVTASITVDDGTNLDDLRELATSLKGMGGGHVRFTTVPLAGQIDSPVFFFTYDRARVHRFFQDLDAPDPAAAAGAAAMPAASTPPGPSTRPAPSAGSAASAISPRSMTVSVLNGSRVGGVANRLASGLTTAGYTLGTVGNLPRGRAEQTEVRYPAAAPHAAAAAAALAARVDGAVTEADRTLAAGNYQFIIGTDIASRLARAAASMTAPAPASAAPASPTPLYTQAPVAATGGCVL
jgi:LCP family protein required for cell wall assembly